MTRKELIDDLNLLVRWAVDQKQILPARGSELLDYLKSIDSVDIHSRVKIIQQRNQAVELLDRWQNTPISDWLAIVLEVRGWLATYNEERGN